MRNVLEKSCRENQNTYLCSITFFPTENCAVNDIMWKNMVDPEKATDDKIGLIRRMRFACLITKGTDTPSEHVILFTS